MVGQVDVYHPHDPVSERTKRLDYFCVDSFPACRPQRILMFGQHFLARGQHIGLCHFRLVSNSIQHTPHAPWVKF